MISIICAFNNKDMLEECLISSLKKQSYKDFEKIMVDTKKLELKSASSALNYGASIAKGDLLVFCHQDIVLTDVDFLKRLVDLSSQLEFGVLGVAGTEIGSNTVITNIFHGSEKTLSGNKTIALPTQAESVDECFFAIKKEKFSGFTDYGNVWHLYAVDYCYKARFENNQDIFVLPLELYHVSPGYSLDISFYTTFKKVVKKYKKYTRIFSSTCYFCENNFFVFLKIDISMLKFKIKKMLKKVKERLR